MTGISSPIAALGGWMVSFTMEDEEMVTQIELSLPDLTATFPVCPYCRGTHLTLTKEIPKRQNEMYRQIA